MAKIQLISRNSSVLTGKETLEPLYTFRNFPIFFGCVNTDPQKDIRADMSWAIDNKTGVIQLDKLVPLDILYQEQHFDGTGPTWQKYNQDFAAYLKQAGIENILEIGGGLGNLADIFLSQEPQATWTIVDPNPMRQSKGRLKIIEGFFDDKFAHTDKFDAIVVSQLLEHIYQPVEFIQSIAKYLDKGGKFLIAYPNLKLMLEKKYTNAINFEHTIFLTDYFLDYLLLTNGFQILDKTTYGEHSHFYHTEYTGERNSISLENKYAEYKNIFLDFVKYHQDLVDDLNSKILEFDGDIYLFGAHIFSTYLLEFGLNKSRIKGILDNSSLKIGKRMYGYNLNVSSPEIIKNNKKVGVILKVGFYQAEVKKQLQQINPNVVILE